MTLTALATRKRYESDVIATHFDGEDVQDSEFTQALRQRSGETIARATFTRNLTVGRLEAGAEVAVNTLDGEMDLTADDGAGPVPVPVPNSNLSVEENRGEAFVSHAWQINPLWSLDSRLAAETSRLSFTGDTEQSVSLTYVKPRVQLTRKFGQHQLQMRVFRDVGQLDFTDFVSTAQARRRPHQWRQSGLAAADRMGRRSGRRPALRQRRGAARAPVPSLAR